jgi:D-sedoheptulose 7-phosphate isomerase
VTEPVAGVESLYPFLYQAPGNDEAAASLLDEVERSCREKAEEIVALRRQVLMRYDDRLDACSEEMAACIRDGGRVYTFGNGGSSTDAAAVAGLFLAPPWGRPVAARSLTAEMAVVTALANDVGFDVVFARQLAAAGRPGDVAVAISTSGGSQNVIQALSAAGRLGMVRVGLAGYEGGRMAEPGLVDHLFVIPSASVHRIQEAQTTVYQELWQRTQRALSR